MKLYVCKTKRPDMRFQRLLLVKALIVVDDDGFDHLGDVPSIIGRFSDRLGLYFRFETRDWDAFRNFCEPIPIIGER